jgi:hypothetical protein
VKCYESASAVSITLKRKIIHYNGKEYSNPAELPPDVRLAYERALHEDVSGKKFVVNGEKFASGKAMPPDDVMSVIENNGEVTIPTSAPNRERLLSKREVGIAIAVGVGIAALVLARIAHG